jgi:hypothetical protein
MFKKYRWKRKFNIIPYTSDSDSRCENCDAHDSYNGCPIYGCICSDNQVAKYKKSKNIFCKYYINSKIKKLETDKSIIIKLANQHIKLIEDMSVIMNNFNNISETFSYNIDTLTISSICHFSQDGEYKIPYKWMFYFKNTIELKDVTVNDVLNIIDTKIKILKIELNN